MFEVMSAAEAHALSRAVIKGESKEQIEHEQQIIAAGIDQAARRGEHSLRLHLYISDCVEEELKEFGYQVTRSKRNVWYDDETIIKW